MQTDVYIKIIIKKNEYKILDGWILVIPAIIAFAFIKLLTRYLLINWSPDLLWNITTLLPSYWETATDQLITWFTVDIIILLPSSYIYWCFMIWLIGGYSLLSLNIWCSFPYEAVSSLTFSMSLHCSPGGSSWKLM